jgi:hypothetical protein
VGVGDVVATWAGYSVYIVNRTQIPEDYWNRELLESTLAEANQTWWLKYDNGTYYEGPHEFEDGKTVWDCEVQLEL